jgi:hypothetical protein
MRKLMSLRTINSLVISCLLLASISGCSSSNDDNKRTNTLVISTANVTLPPVEGSISLLAQTFDLSDIGYEDAEYFIAGSAASFTNINELTVDGEWQVAPSEQAEYKTRIVVHRPVDPSKFSGTVMVEWLNVTAGFDVPFSWTAGHNEMYRSGHIWIGVSAQLVGIEGSVNGLAPFNLKDVNPDRYSELNHPGDSFSYDIFTQIAGLVRTPQEIDVLAGMQANYLLALGQSQSANRLTTYVNAVQPLYNAYDGFIIHSRTVSSSSLSGSPLIEITTPAASKVRADSKVPVMTFQTETDVTGLGYVSARQDDSDNFILWEVAGTGHIDNYMVGPGRSDSDGDSVFAAVSEVSTVLGLVNCDLPINAGPVHYVFQSALRAMDTWMRSGERPPAAERLNLVDYFTYEVDDNGNATGGIRTPYVDAPSATLTGNGNTGALFCRLVGTTSLFRASEMASLYTDQDGFVSAVTTATDSAVEAGFILAEDGAAIIEWASQQWQIQL